MTFGSTFGRTFSPTFQPKSQAAASAAAWSPTDISGCVIWLDFGDADYLFTDAGTTKVSSDGNAIYQVNDKSGNNNHAVQSSATLRPLYKTNIQNSKSAALFDGSNDVMTLPDLTITDISVFLAFRHLNGTGAHNALYAYDNYNTTPRNTIQIKTRYSLNNNYMSECVFNGTGNTTSAYALTENNPYLIDVVKNSTNCYVSRNATSLETITVGSTQHSMVGHRLGTHFYNGANQSEYAKSYVCELLIYNGGLSSGDKSSVRAYLNNKWAIY